MKKILIAVMALVLVTSMGAVFAYKGNTELSDRPFYSEERHATMTEIFETGDYDAWVALMSEHSKGRVLEVVNEENFALFVEMHNAMIEGDNDRANELRTELGLGQGRKGFNGKAKGNCMQR